MIVKLSRDPGTPIKYSSFAFFCRTKQGSRGNNYCNIFIVETMNNKFRMLMYLKYIGF